MYWDRQDDRWSWSSGRWERRPDRRTRWIKPRYQREDRAWRYEPGRWSDQQLVEGDD
jgi:WXXGXW repeat (2 copies)